MSRRFVLCMRMASSSLFLTALPSYPAPLQSYHPHGYRSTSGCYRYPGTSPRKPHPATLSPPTVHGGEGSRGGATECPACRGTRTRRPNDLGNASTSDHTATPHPPPSQSPPQAADSAGQAPPPSPPPAAELSLRSVYSPLDPPLQKHRMRRRTLPAILFYFAPTLEPTPPRRRQDNIAFSAQSLSSSRSLAARGPDPLSKSHRRAFSLSEFPAERRAILQLPACPHDRNLGHQIGPARSICLCHSTTHPIARPVPSFQV